MDFTSLAFSKRKYAEHQLIAALLRSDAVVARELLAGRDVGKWVNDFIKEATTDNLPVLVYKRITQLGLHERFAQLSTKDGGNALSIIRTRATTATAEYAVLSDLLSRLIRDIGTLSGKIIFVKGTVLSRTLYEEGPERFSVDFDAVAKPEWHHEIVITLAKVGYTPIWTEPGHCHQFGVGPTRSIEDLFVVPSVEFVGCQNLTFIKPGWPEFEIKFNPVETGLRMVESDRFFERATHVEGTDCNFLAPDLADHLLVELVHFHKHQFGGWGWLYDIHLLCEQLVREDLWTEFARRAKVEGLEETSRIGLQIARDMLQSPVPSRVMDELTTVRSMWWTIPYMQKISVEFVWNSNSIAMLLTNAICLGDTRRKLTALAKSMFPASSFLSGYYGDGGRLNFGRRCFFLFVHSLILFMPAGAIRRSFGPSFFAQLPSPEVQKGA